MRVDKATTAAIIRTITDNEIGVTSFDPLVAHHSATENATGDMDLVIREFARIANVTECAIEIVHHTRKPAPGQEELGVVDSRGAGAIVDAVRSARVLNTMSKSEADGAGVDDVDRQLHFRIDRGKANMAPPTAARWYKIHGVDVPNCGTVDNIGIATRYVFPGQAERRPRSCSRPSARPTSCSCRCWCVSPTRGAGSVPARGKLRPSVFAKERAAKAAKLASTPWPQPWAGCSRPIASEWSREEARSTMSIGSSSFVTVSGARGADVALTWRGERPRTP